MVEGSTTYGDEKINLEDFMLSYREKLVLKPAEGAGGKDVHVGYHTSKNRWEELLLKALHGKSWVVQERVESLPFLLQRGESGFAVHDVVWGLFVFGSRYGGITLRVLSRENSNGVINAKKGARSSVVFEVDE